MGDPLYRRLLGAATFDALPPVLREFHRRGGRAEGVVDVEGGRSSLARAVARRAGLPPEGKGVPVILEVEVEGERERWRRRFDGRLVESVQWTEDGFLLERIKGATFRFRLVGVDDGVGAAQLRFASIGWRALGAWWPRALSPCASAVVSGSIDGRGWDVGVEVRAPVVGRLCGYHGTMRPV